MSKRKNKNQLPVVLVILIVIIVSVVSVLNSQKDDGEPVNKVSTNGDSVVIHYLDVGQGDSEFIELPDGRCMLIDASTSEYSQTIINEIESFGYSTIDYVVATHPHADHIGGMSKVIDAFDIGEIYMPKASTTTKTFENLLTTISDKGLSVNTAKAGVEVYSDSTLEMEFLAPVGSDYKDLNNYSAVLKITYGSNSFLFMGDAEDVVEEELLQRYYNSLEADVLKVGHHGSSSSSTVDFLAAVNPQYAVISCGVDNSYGHPHRETIKSLTDMGIEYYRTDKQGTITITCDGNGGFDIETEGK
ncbi:MAG: MBL fold metallo-hydrolase [Eubacterium sp.]|nr:MBL fold metallo-hydrolase [Eubacterium sp.]